MKKMVLLSLVIVLMIGLIISGCTKEATTAPPTTAIITTTTTQTTTSIMTATATTTATTTTVQQPVVLKLVSFKPDVPPANIYEHMLMDKVKAKTNGLLTIDWIGGPEAIPPPDTPGAVQRGSIDMVSALFGYIDTLVPGWECLGNMTLSIESFRKSAAWNMAADLLREKGIYFLGYSTPSKPQRMMAIYSKDKISTIDDFKGMKFAVQGPAYAAMLTALGAAPSIIPMSDYFTAMERGTVDAFHVGIPGIIDWGCIDVTNYMLDNFMGDSSSAFLVNLDVWNKLPKNFQDALNSAVIEQEQEGEVAWESIITDVENQVTAGGVEITSLPPADAQKLHDVYMQTTWDFTAKKNPDLVAKFKAIVAP
jgi:TRAP-type C4-dicarboxylate transport system substrate-binding protein